MEYVKTKHLLGRISQRGLSKDILEIVLKFGNSKGDKITLNKKMTQKVIKELDDLRKKLTKENDSSLLIKKSTISTALVVDFRKNINEDNVEILNDSHDLLEQIAYERATLIKILDKGGVSIVAEGNILITAYNMSSILKRRG